MNTIKNKQTKIIIGRIFLCFACAAVIIIFVWSWYAERQQSKLDLKSRYTFNITIDSAGNVLEDYEAQLQAETVAESVIEEIKINQIADLWIQGFTGQFTQRYVPRTKALKDVRLDASKVLDAESNTVLVSFSAQLKDSESEFFSSWNGIISDGRFYCEWVIQYEIDNHYDNTATIYVSEIFTPEAYGISQYNESLKAENSGSLETTTIAENSLASYEIRNDTLYVTYDGERMITVPIDCSNLPMVNNSTTELRAGSYQISMGITSFLYGGATIGGNRVPLTLCYSADKGENWTTCEIDTIYTADYYYVNFLDESHGVIVCGYDRNEDIQESSRIYMTSDGGETWNMTGSGPTTNIIKGVLFIDENIGFFCYDYVDGMDSNLYVTRDAGKTFSKVTLEEQELDSTAANSSTEASSSGGTEVPTDDSIVTNGNNASDLTSGDNKKLVWSDVYKEALLPIYDTDGVLTIYLTQGKDGVYNSGKTAAKYQSSDRGVTWKYISQLEITTQ